MANSTGADLAKKFSEYAGKKDQYDVREVTSVDGVKQTQLVDKDTGSVSFAWNGDLPKNLDGFGSVGGDAAVSPKEAVNDNKVFRTSKGVLATPTQPEALLGAAEAVEVDHTNNADKLQDNQRSSGEASSDVTESKVSASK